MAGFRHLPLKRAVKENQQLTCRIKGCSRKRYQVATLCQKHLTTKRNCGHPEGRLHTISEFEITMNLTAEVIRLNREHLLISSALGFIDRLLWRSNNSGTPALSRYAERYVRKVAERVEMDRTPGDRKVTIPYILTLISAMATEHYNRHSPFLDDVEFLANIGTRFIRLSLNQGNHIRRTPRRQIEKLLWRKLGQACLVIRDAANKMEAEKYKRKELEAIPLKTSD